MTELHTKQVKSASFIFTEAVGQFRMIPWKKIDTFNKSRIFLLLIKDNNYVNLRERKHTYYGKFMIISGTLVKLFIDNLIVVIFDGRCDKEPV